jgi:hypothetical protein
MMNKDTRSNLIITLLFPLLGLVILVICFFAYFAVSSLFRLLLKEQMPMGFIRQMFAMTLVLFYLLILRFKFSEKVKALLMIGPLGTLIITIILTFYQNLPIAIALLAILVFSIVYVLHRFHKSWYYYYSLALAVLAAIAYGWPRPL